MGYDQYTVPDTVAVKPTFVAFLFFPLISTHKHTSMTFRTILSNFFQEKWTTWIIHNTDFGMVACTLSDNLSRNIIVYLKRSKVIEYFPKKYR